MNKKGQGISMTYIIIAALALVVLVVIVLFFTGGIQSLIGSQEEVVTGVVPDWKIQAWTSRCKLSCSTNPKDFCTAVFVTDEDTDNYWVCDKDKSLDPSETAKQGRNVEKDLAVECTGITASDCNTYTP